jgi:hypothetical protein
VIPIEPDSIGRSAPLKPAGDGLVIGDAILVASEGGPRR